MKNIYLLLFLSYTYCVNSSPWIDNEDDFFRMNIESLIVECNLSNIHSDSNPVSTSTVYKKLNEEISNETETCFSKKDTFKKEIFKQYMDKKTYIGFQSKSSENYFQEIGKRYLPYSNFHYLTSDLRGNFFYQVKITHFEVDGKKKEIFDESFIAFKKNNAIFSIGRISNWWSPSWDNSLILSNSARPSAGISVRNFESIKPSSNFVKKFLTSYNYNIFLNQLEKNRDYPRTNFLGNRFEFLLFNRLNFSIFRTAQFGGEGRNVNLKTIERVLSGKDTTNRNLLFDEQSGNQIAGIDFSFRLLKSKRLKLYGQYLGEDGLDPIIDDRWIGAIFPSKRFGGIGIGYTFGFDNISHLRLDRIDTESDKANVTYNHSLYTDGYRHYNKPIGANIDADSERMVLSLNKLSNKNFYRISYSKSEINKNKSITNYLSKSFLEKEEIKLKLSRKINEKLQASLIMSYKNYSIDVESNPFHAFIDIKYIIN